MRWLILLVAVACLTVASSTAEARLFGRRFGGGGGGVSGVPEGCHNKTAQGVAECMARVRRCCHFGGNPGYEGCGMAGSKEAAYNICCYHWMRTVDVGYAQDTSGNWYCCRRY